MDTPKTTLISASIEAVVAGEYNHKAYVVYEKYDWHESGETECATLFNTYDEAKEYLLHLL